MKVEKWPENRFFLALSKDIRTALKEDGQEMGMTPQDFLRHLLRNWMIRRGEAKNAAATSQR